jgi:hypothetical protein
VVRPVARKKVHAGSTLHTRQAPRAEGQEQSRTAGLHQSLLSVHQFRGLLPTRTKHTLVVCVPLYSARTNHSLLSHTANTNGNHGLSRHRMQASGHSPSYWLGQGTDPSITDMYHSKSCPLLWVPLRRIFSNSRQKKGHKKTIPLPTSHDLSFRTSFSFSPFGFFSVAFVTRYQPVAQSLFHTLSHQGRLSGTCH